MDEMEQKRQVPPVLKKILAIDADLSEKLSKVATRFVPLKQLVVHYKVLEISCHGIPWISCLLAFIWILNSKSLYQMQVNLLLALIIDLICVAVIKAAVRRRRPTVNDDKFCVGPDKYSFPSGHASRATLIVYFLLNLYPVSVFFVPSLFAWSFCVCASRIMMRRHHILDVCAGIMLGLLEGMLMSHIYLEQQTCASLIYWITEEKLDGAEYDI